MHSNIILGSINIADLVRH